MSKKVPQLRFNGYSDAWVQRNLGDVIENQYNGQTPSRNNPSFWGGEIPWLTSGELNHGIVNDTVETITSAGQKDANLKIVPAGTFVMAITGLEAPGTRGNSSILGFDTTVNQSVMALFPNEKLDTKFLFQWYQKVGEEYGISYTQGTKQQSYNAELIKILPFTLPDNVQEQQRVAELLFKLDDLIAANQRKLDLLKEQKKGYLQKMFPKNGAKVPELRFAGFADDWEERKAKDLFIPVNERNREDLPVLSVTQDQGVVFRNDLAIDIKYDESTLSSYKVIHPGDFVISLRSFQGGFELSNVLGISSPAYTIFDFSVPAEQDKLYWKAIFKTFKFIESLKTVTFGIRDGKSISFKEFGDLKLNYPSDVDEQRRIGEFFTKLDDTIALHQRKLDLLKEQKKGFLQKMFV